MRSLIQHLRKKLEQEKAQTVHKPGCGCTACTMRKTSDMKKKEKFSIITVYDKDPDNKNSAYWGMGINKKRKKGKK